jgi:DNA-binding NarL/FixJ family response regulator
MATLLIADDSPGKMQMLQALAKASGWAGKMVTAATSEEAFELIDHETEITIALIDYYIPTQNGPSIIRRLKAHHPACRIALVSSARSERNTKEAMESGADTVICTTDTTDVVEGQLLDFLLS